MKTVELRDASKPLADYAAGLRSEFLVITSNRKPVAALVSLGDTDRESLALSLSPQLARIIRRARLEARKGQVFSLKQVKEELLAESAAANRPTPPVHAAAKARRVPSTRNRRSPRRG